MNFNTGPQRRVRRMAGQPQEVRTETQGEKVRAAKPGEKARAERQNEKVRAGQRDEKARAEKRDQEMRVTCSGILRKGGKKIIYVRFERGKDYAEGSIPAAKITSQSGFSPEEVAQFEEYLSEHEFEIIEQAKTVNLMKNFMK